MLNSLILNIFSTQLTPFYAFFKPNFKKLKYSTLLLKKARIMCLEMKMKTKTKIKLKEQK